jgi:hypothetical protein
VRQPQGAVDELHPILAAQAQIGDHKINAVILQGVDRARDIAGDVDIETIFQRGAETFARVAFVIDD